MKKLLHIAAHLGAGAGKAISGIVKNTALFENTVALLEPPADTRYCDICMEAGARVVISPERCELLRLAGDSDAVILSWWAHPLTVGLLADLGDISTRLVLWTHINGLQYPVLPAGFLLSFDKVLFTSPCSLKNESFTDEQREQILSRCGFVYGTGDFRPALAVHKTSYTAGGKIKAGYVGTLDFAKLNPGFPKICAGIKQRVPEAEFILCGKYTPEFRKAFFADFPELEECVRFAGFVSEPDKLLPEFDLFCYPLSENNYATTENALLEAMAAGLPTAVLGNPAEREIVEDGKTGIIAADPADFIERTAALCRDENRRKTLGSAARQAVIEKYDSGANARSFIAAVSDVLHGEKRRHELKSVAGADLWQSFLYFCGREKSSILRIMNGEKLKLPDIFYSGSKSSPEQYKKYSDAPEFAALTTILNKY